MRSLRSALVGASLIGVACGGGSHPDQSDASAPEAAARTTPLSVARGLSMPRREIAEVLSGRIAIRAEGEGFAALPTTPGDLALHVAAKASAKTRIGTDDDHSLLLSIDGAQGSNAESDDGAVLHRDVFPGTDAIWATTEARAELLFLLRDQRAPKTFQVHVERGAALLPPERERDGFSFRDDRGNVRLHIPKPIAVDAAGVSRAAEMSFSADGRTLTVALDDTGLAFPILLDPAVAQARWTKIGDRTYRTRATFSWDPVRGKLLGYGGYGPDGADNLKPGKTSPTLFEYVSPGGTFNGLADGPIGMTTAMFGGLPPWENYGFVGTFDSARNKLMAFGGQQYDCMMGCKALGLMEVWEWTSATNAWAQVCTSAACAASAPSTGSPPPFIEAVYDELRKVSVVCDTGARACKTWNGATGAWTAITAFPVTMGHGWYDATYQAATYFGADGTYSWNGTSWVKRTTGTLSSAAGVAYDTLRKRAVAVNPTGLLTSDTYEWDGSSANWLLVVPASDSTPPVKPSLAMGYDRLNGRVVAWGGGKGYLGATSSYDMVPGLYEYKAYGNTCAGDADCYGGSCRDGFCCDTKCGACQRCDGPGNGGVCAPVIGAPLVGTEHDTCTGTKACDTSGACKSKNGQACSAGTDCASGACVDGFCCNAACNQACEVCNVTPGTCTAAPKGAGGRTSCGVGSCNGTSHVCSTSCATDADCSASGFCNAGTCVAVSAQGTACTRDRQCASGSCHDGFCCSSGCSGPCETCAKAKGASADGTCTPLPAATKPAACGGYACSGTSGACAIGCTDDAGCTSGYYCDGAFCQKARAQGDGCTRTGQCGTGLTCADGVCCNSACDGVCQACSAANKESGDAPGVCGQAKIGTDPGDRCPTEDSTTCGKSGKCGASGTCALWPKGSACGSGVTCDGSTAKGRTCDGLGTCVETAGASCAPGACSTTSGCTFTCTTSSDCDASGYCDAGTCRTRALVGRTCTADDQCATGVCADGVCCATACKGLCEACNAGGTEGTCTAITGVPREGHGACPGAGGADACTATACDGTARDTCKAFAGPEVSCRTASCTDGLETLATKCDGTGSCPAASTRTCAPFACAGTRCASKCVTNDDCAKGNRCDVGTGKCVSNGTCDGDHTVVGADGSKTECAPYKCNDDGCKTACVTSDECAAPAICDGNKCVVSEAPSGDSGGCATSPPRRGGSMLAGLLVVLFAARRRISKSKEAR
ncbi:MAG: hypothetical protein ACXVEE_08545 [Polyangiales bacterium]